MKKKTIKQYPAKFEYIYNALCQQDFSSLERIRKQSKTYNIISSFLAVTDIILFIIAVTSKNITASNLLLTLTICIVLLISFAFFKYQNNKLKRQYQLQYRNKIISSLINMFNPNLEYNTDDVLGKQLKEQYDMANFWASPTVVVKAKDCMVGRINNTYVEMCDIKTYHHHHHQEYNDIELTFKGVFAIISNKSNINSQIQIINVSNYLNDFDAEYQVDNNEFEKYFSIKADDKILTTRILTHDVTNSLLNSYKNYGIRFDICIKNHSTYIRFYSLKTFMSDIKKHIFDKEQLYDSFALLQCIDDCICAITESINTLDV